jgi:hypothetical protein
MLCEKNTLHNAADQTLKPINPFVLLSRWFYRLHKKIKSTNILNFLRLKKQTDCVFSLESRTQTFMSLTKLSVSKV